MIFSVPSLQVTVKVMSFLSPGLELSKSLTQVEVGTEPASGIGEGVGAAIAALFAQKRAV